MDFEELILNFLFDAQEEGYFKSKTQDIEKKVEELLKQFYKAYEMNESNSKSKLFFDLENSIMEMRGELKKEFFKLGYLAKKSEIERNK